MFWNVKDGAYGMRGHVLGRSEFYAEPCVSVQFKGHPYHCKVSSLKVSDPKRLRRARLAAQQMHSTSSVGSSWTEVENTASTDDSTCHGTSPSVAPWASQGKTRAYGRSQAASRCKRLLSRRSHRQRCREANLAAQEAVGLQFDPVSDFLCLAVAH